MVELKIILLGITYSSQSSQITDWKTEILSERGEFLEELIPLSEDENLKDSAYEQ